MNGEMKVGLFVLVGSVLFGTAVFLLGDFSFQRYYNLNAEFTDVAGLPDKAVVKLSGVEVGKIKKILLNNDRVVVHMAIEEGVKIYRNSRFLVGSTSMIGSKFLEVDQGTPSAGVIEPGDTVIGESAVPLDRALSKAVDNLQGLVSDIRGQGLLARDLKEILENMRQVTVNVNEMVRNTQPHAENSMKRLDEITVKLQDVAAKTDAIVDKINSGEGVAGALLTDQKMKQNVTETLNNVRDASVSVKEVLGRVNKFRLFMRWDYRYEPVANGSKDDFGIKIYPREGHYYYLGGSNLDSGSNRARGVDYESKNTLDAQFGWDGRHGFDFYAGALHGAPGAGLRWEPFYNSKWDSLVLMLEASDFGRNRVIKGHSFTRANVNAGASVNFNKNIAAGVRLQDLAETKRFEYTTRVMFEDKDIAYLFGLVSLGASTKGASATSK